MSEGYKESDSHRPNPTDLVGTIDTTNTGAGPWGDVTKTSVDNDVEGSPPEAKRIYEQIRAVDEGTPAEASEGEEAEESETDEATKDELYERAGELNIKGRSKMDKDELAAAVEEAEAEES